MMKTTNTRKCLHDQLQDLEAEVKRFAVRSIESGASPCPDKKVLRDTAIKLQELIYFIEGYTPEVKSVGEFVQRQ